MEGWRSRLEEPASVARSGREEPAAVARSGREELATVARPGRAPVVVEEVSAGEQEIMAIRRAKPNNM